ncbi:MAG: alpha/beta hydrolase [Melioribacteraceae bacterium]
MKKNKYFGILRIILLSFLINPLGVFSQEELLEKPDGYLSNLTLKIAYFFGSLDLIEKDFPIATDIIEHKDIIYKTIDSTNLKLDIYHTKNISAKKPLLVFIHGGAWKKGDKHDYLRYLIDFAKKGYVTATIQYRFSDKAKFPAQLLDVKAAIIWLKKNSEKYFIDSKKIAVIGGSAGGHLAMMVAYTSDIEEFNKDEDSLYSSKVQAIVDIYGVYDLATEYAREKSSVKNLIGKNYIEDPELFINASPKTYITKDDPPTLIFHGTIDELVPVSQSDSLTKHLGEIENEVEYHRLDGWPHTMDLSVEVNEYCQFYMLKFFKKHIPF